MEGDFMPGTTRMEDIFSEDVRNLIKRDMLDLEQEQSEQAIASFDPKLLRDEMAIQVGKSLGVGKDYLDTDDGQKTMYQIAEFLEKERNVDQVKAVSSALVSVLESLAVPQEMRYPEGLAKRLKDYLMSKKMRAQDKEKLDGYGKVWGVKPLS